MVVVSELVTNAVRHAGLAAGAPIEVSGEVRRGRVTLMVRDRGVGLPAMAPPSAPPPSSAGSRGLYLVGAPVHAGADGPAGRRRDLRLRALTGAAGRVGGVRPA